MLTFYFSRLKEMKHKHHLDEEDDEVEVEEIDLEDPPVHNRLEEGWTKKNDVLVQNWKTKFEELSAAHGAKGMAHKKWHTYIGLPKVMIPGLMTGVTSAFADWEYIYIINFLGFATTTLLTAYYDFYGFAEQKQKNDQHSAAYADMVSTIDVNQARGPEFREPADRFIEKLQASYDYLTKTAPDL